MQKVKNYKKIVIIFTSQRSGSTALIQKLRQFFSPDIAIYEECFLKKKVENTLNVYPDFKNILPKKRFFEQSNDVGTYLNSLLQNKKCLIFKLMLDQIDSELAQYIQHDHKYYDHKLKKIYFVRNIFDRSISSANVKLKKSKAHYLNKKSIIKKKNTNKGFMVSILAVYYYLKNLFYFFSRKSYLNECLIVKYPDFDQVKFLISELISDKDL